MDTQKQDIDDYVFHITKNPKEAVYWQPEVEAVMLPRSREMLENYTGLSSEQLIAHIKEAQDRSFKVMPYPSIGAMTWLNPMILVHFSYRKILDRVKNGVSILDCACMVAQDLRQLAYDGARTNRMYAFDLNAEFFEIGFDFFRDRKRWEGNFFQADALKDLSETQLGELIGRLDIIWCAKFIHIFDWDDQINMTSKLVRLLKPETGSMFVGSQNGFPGGRRIQLDGAKRLGNQKNSIYACDVNDIKELFVEVTKRLGIEFEVEATLLDLRTMGMHKDDGSGYKKITGYNIQYTATVK